MKKIMVSGATSMIGVALIDIAITKGAQVYAIVRHGTSRINRLPQSNLVHIVEAGMDSYKEMDVPLTDCDVFFHFAWAGTNKTERDDPVVQEANIRHTLDAVELAKACGCRKFIGAGSQAEYGPTEGSIDDSSRFKPVTAYGAAKLSAGILSRKLCERYGITHIWGRIFSVYGRHDNDYTMISYAIDKMLQGETAEFSSGTQSWNYLNERDAGEIFYRLGDAIEETSEYRIANDTSKPLRSYIEEIANLLKADNLCRFSENDGSKLYGLETTDDNLFAKIGYRPKISFISGINEVIESKRQERKLN